MKDLVKIKNKIRDFIRNFDDIIVPVIRLIWAFVVFTSINKVFTYSSLFSKEIFEKYGKRAVPNASPPVSWSAVITMRVSSGCAL